METKNVSLKKRIQKAHSKAKFAGFLYNFGSIVLLAILFLPLITVTHDDGPWDLSVLTFFKPFLALDLGLNYATLKSLPVAIVFLVMILVAFIHLFKCFKQGKDLGAKNPTMLNGYNRPYFAAVEMGRTYSFTLWTIIVGYFGIYFTEATLNVMYVAIALGVTLLIHFWAGLVMGSIPMYDVTPNTVVEDKRADSLGKHFLANLIQVIATGLIVYFFAVGTTVKGLMHNLIVPEVGISQFLELGSLIPLLVQILLLIFIVYLIKQSTGIKEYQHAGIYVPAIRCFNVLAWFAAITAIAWIVVEMLIGSKALCTEALLIVAVAIVGALLDASTRPSKKALKQAEKEAAEREANAVEEVAAVPAQKPVKPASYRIPLSGLTEPAIFLQPNGQPLMVMPKLAGAQPAPMYAPPAPMAAPAVPSDPGYAYAYNNPYEEQASVSNPYAPAYWGNGAPHGFAPVQQEPVVEAEPIEETVEPDAKEAKKAAAAQKKAEKEAKANQKKAEQQAAKKEKAEKKQAAVAAKKAKDEQKKAEKNAAKQEKAAQKKAKKEAKKGNVEVAPTAVAPAVEQPAAPVAAPAIAPAPAPAELQPTPAPVALASNVAAENSQEDIVVPVGLPEGFPPSTVAPVTEELLPTPAPAPVGYEAKAEDRQKHEVVCPDCGKNLSVKDGAMAYRCPACGGLFQLQKTKKLS